MLKEMTKTSRAHLEKPDEKSPSPQRTSQKFMGRSALNPSDGSCIISRQASSQLQNDSIGSIKGLPLIDGLNDSKLSHIPKRDNIEMQHLKFVLVEKE